MVQEIDLGRFEDFLLNQPINVDYIYLVVALVVAAILSFILAKLYVRYGTTISNRSKFSSNFILLSVTTTLIIIIVKSSLALSLGLVGALSIVRFRSAIKEPEELCFLFIAISIGLGLGAGQLITTLIAFTIISIIIYGRKIVNKNQENQNLYLTISGKAIKLKDIVNVLNNNSISLKLKRFDEIDNKLEASFLIEFKSFENLETMKEELREISKSLNISYLDKSGI